MRDYRKILHSTIFANVTSPTVSKPVQSFTHEQEKALKEALDNPNYRVKNKEEIKVVYYLGLYTGQRLKDCVLLRWSKVNLAQKKIECKQFKTGKEVTIPIAPQLVSVLEDALTWKTDDYGYVCPKVAERYNTADAQGKNIGSGLVNIDVLRVLKWIGLKTSVKVEGRSRAITVFGFTHYATVAMSCWR